MKESLLRKKLRSHVDTKWVLLTLFLVVELVVVIVAIQGNLSKDLFLINLLFIFQGVFMYALYHLLTAFRRHQSITVPFFRKIGLLPSITESSAYVMAITALILLITNRELLSEMFSLAQRDEEGNIFVVVIYIGIGIYISLYHAFSHKEKSIATIRTIQSYTAVTLALVATSTAIYIYQNEAFYFLPLVIWNSIQAIVLMFFSGNRDTGEFLPISSRNATLPEIATATVVACSVLAIEYWSNTHWSVAFSSVMVVWYICSNYFERETPAPNTHATPFTPQSIENSL